MNSRIHSALDRLFEKHRIIFWYDTDCDLQEEFSALELVDVEKIELENNDFGVKHRVIRDAPNQKFLLYHQGERPADTANWLLDVLLSHGQFSTDQVGIWLSELELGPEFRELVAEHAAFFNATSRREALKKLIEPNDSLGKTRINMMSVCLRDCDPRLDTVLEALLNELANERAEGMDLLIKFNLSAYFWEQAERIYAYRSESPGVLDFAIELFQSAYQRALHGTPKLNQEASILLQRWKNNRQNFAGFEELSNRLALLLDIADDLQERDYRTLVNIDYFESIELCILHALIVELVASSTSPENCRNTIRKRRQSHWFGRHADMYSALEHAANFFEYRSTLSTEIGDLGDGLKAYAKNWYQLDYFYRKFIHHANLSSQPTLLKELREKVENHYTNSFLLPLNNNWQVKVDGLEEWGVSGVPLASSFFKNYVQPILNKDQKVVVFISDAFRYEAAVELVSRIRQEDRFDAEIEPMLSMLPSYTQLGMAALLPHQSLEMKDRSKALISADGQSTAGTENRAKILRAVVDSGATAIQARDVVNLDRQAARALFRENSVIYIYHNRIDAVGDKRDTEERVFQAVENTLTDLIDLIKRMANANATNLLVTADHGFIYQDRPLEESDFLAAEPKGADIQYRDRRFVIGLGLQEQKGFKTWSASQLGLAGDTEFQIPKSINRLRRKGSGSRFVHGGATLQEVVIPVVQINKKRSSDLGKVEVDLIQSTSSTITSNQLVVTFYQTEPVTDKLQARKLRAGFYAQDGQLISDAHELLFDHASENPREREQKVQFVLTRDADKLSGQHVNLVINEPIDGTSQEQKYKSVSYLLRISFGSDFEF